MSTNVAEERRRAARAFRELREQTKNANRSEANMQQAKAAAADAQRTIVDFFKTFQQDELFVQLGSEVYRLTLDANDDVLVTQVDVVGPGDRP